MEARWGEARRQVRHAYACAGGCVCGDGGARTCKLSPPVIKWPRREPVEWSRDVSACRLYGHGSRSVVSFWHTSWMWEICVAVMNAIDEAPHGESASAAA